MPEPAVIAVVDDDESLCASLVALLRSYGFEARDFASAEAFLAAEDAGACDCIVADVHMPGMTGIDLKLALVNRQCLVPVILITARTDAGVEARARASGALCLLKKPFRADALMRCVDKALGR